MERIWEKITIALIIIACFVNDSFALENEIISEFVNTEKDLNDVFVQKLLEGWQEDSEEAIEYRYETSVRISAFLDELESIKAEDYRFLQGNWKLYDEKGKIVKDAKGFFLSNSIDIFNLYKDCLTFRDGDSHSIIYKNANDDLFIKTLWLCAIRQIKIIDDKMYLYILDGDYWYLDSIHEGGRYYFAKTDDKMYIGD